MADQTPPPIVRERIVNAALGEIRVYFPLPCSPADAARIAAGEEPTGPTGLAYLAYHLGLVTAITKAALDSNDTNVKVEELYAINQGRGDEDIVAIAQMYVRETHLLAELSRLEEAAGKLWVEGKTIHGMISVNDRFQDILFRVLGLSPRNIDHKMKAFKEKVTLLLHETLPDIH